MNIILLTHQREVNKTSNTGSLVVDVLGDQAKLIVWERTKPSPALLKILSQGLSALLYPSDTGERIAATDMHQSYVIIDGTWQEARKIYNRSPYLHDLPAVKIQTNRPSAYNLRRNQKPGCFCTAECVIEVLRLRGFHHQADALQSKLAGFLGSVS